MFSQISEDHLCTHIRAEICVTVYYSFLFPAYIVRAHTQLTLHTLSMMHALVTRRASFVHALEPIYLLQELDFVFS